MYYCTKYPTPDAGDAIGMAVFSSKKAWDKARQEEPKGEFFTLHHIDFLPETDSV